MIKKGIIFYLVSLLTACSVSSPPLTIDERYNEATNDLKQLFSEQEKPTHKMDFYEALARGVKYNLDYRVKLVNTALQIGQLKVAEFTMFPALNATGSLYTRSNAFSSFGITTAGTPTDVLNATPDTVRSARIALSWNILDFGINYVRAKEQSEKVLIAEEEARRQLQQLAQEILVSYWSAYSAQQLMDDTKAFQKLLQKSKAKLVVATKDYTIPKESILNYQAALLEGERRLIQLQYKYDKAISELRHLLFLPVDQKIVLAPLPAMFRKAQNLRYVDLQKMDAITLVSRPELRGQQYQQRIAKFGVKTVILQSLPGITPNYGAWNYNSNKFLINNIWLDRSVDVSWNLLNLASLPTTYKTAEFQVKFERLKLMALTMTALTETRYAFAHYNTLRREYAVAHKQYLTAQELYQLNSNRRLASLASDQQVILSRLKAIAAKMDENLLISDLSTVLGELYLSIGVDILPPDIMNLPLDKAVKALKRNFAIRNNANFPQFINLAYSKIFPHSNCDNKATT